MRTSLLESLKKYCPREGKDSLENFITEAFAWLLQNFPDFSEYFLEVLKSYPNMKLDSFDPTNCEWITQYNFEGLFPDMVCLSGDNAIVFEHKAWSNLHEHQLKNYVNYSENHFKTHKMVLITASQYQHEQDPDLALCWHDIHDIITRWINRQNDNLPFIFKDFLDLLNSEGMGPPAPISHESIKYYYSSVNLKNEISNLVRNVESRKWSSNIKNGYSLFIEERKGSVYGEAWGRIGLNLLDKWRPGIFVGILVDGNDHHTDPINLNKGPDFCLIISFHNDLHNLYRTNASYIELINNLSKKISKSNEGWQFYDHLSDSNQKSKNKWHPIHIRKPMLDVFWGTSTIEDQSEKFYQEAIKLINLVTEEPSFWKLREEYK